MATSVIQLVPVDPSLAANPDFSSMAEYIITGTYYVVDNAAMIVYVWNENTPGPNNYLVESGGSYAQFQAFLASNPPVVQANPANYPTPTPSQNEQTVLLRGILMSLISLATSGNNYVPGDFYPLNSPLS